MNVLSLVRNRLRDTEKLLKKNEMLAVNIVEVIKGIRIRRTTDGRTERQTERQTDRRKTDRQTARHCEPQYTTEYQYKFGLYVSKRIWWVHTHAFE